ncbi:hypothetical protein [Dyella acidisoli]|uniref:hypothetical protein n=1 Tax=Dyella acidisoli TaxID=1867834 RepID=UPI0024E0F6DD|nr:hypothetical protein [Dyella acidisoli]
MKSSVGSKKQKYGPRFATKHQVTSFLLLLLCFIFLPIEAREIPPGGADYPKPNPNPKYLFLVHGQIDSSIKVSLYERFVATNPACSDFTRQTIWVGTREPYGVTVPLKLGMDGLRYRTRVAVDAVLPGRCLWEFRGVIAKGSDIQGYELAFVNGANLTPINSPPLKPGQSPDGVLDERCTLVHIENGISPPLSMECKAANIPYRTSAMWWYPSTQDIEINFHQG